jgi:thioredoxin reductase
MHDLIVLGGGPAGLTATMYAVQKRLDVLLITRDLGRSNHQPFCRAAYGDQRR